MSLEWSKLQTCMRSEMLFQVTRSFKPLSAGIYGAIVRPFICVNSNVRFVAVAGGKSFAAAVKVTFEWSIPGVTSHVNLKTAIILDFNKISQKICSTLAYF